MPLHTPPGVLHVPQVRFIKPPFQMKHCFTIVTQYEASSASLPIWSVPIGTFFDNLRQSNRLAFFVLNSLFGELRERENAIKQPKFSVLPFLGTPRLCSKSADFSLFKWRKNKSPTIFLWIKTPWSLCPRPFYLNTFVLNQQKIVTIYRPIKTPTIFKTIKPVTQQSV